MDITSQSNNVQPSTYTAGIFETADEGVKVGHVGG